MRPHPQQQQGHVALFPLPAQKWLRIKSSCHCRIRRREGLKSEKRQQHWYLFVSSCRPLWHGSHDIFAIDHLIAVPASPLIVGCARRRRGGRRNEVGKIISGAERAKGWNYAKSTRLNASEGGNVRIIKAGLRYQLSEQARGIAR